MTVTVVCRKAGCSQQDRVKTVGRQHLGQGVYLAGAMLCECGSVLVENPE